jgi:hypothetical protein
MTSQPASPRRTFTTPLSGRDLLEPGQIFPREELLRRVLSVFWRSCCGVPGLARAPAPVLELSNGGRSRARAWWVLYDGIIEESEGPHAERLGLFFGAKNEPGQLWPRYTFELLEGPFAVDMNFQHDAALSWNSRVNLELLPSGSVHVIGRAARKDPRDEADVLPDA